MPRTRSRRTRRRSRRSRRATRGQIYGRAAGQLWRDVQKLKNFVNVEFKITEVTSQSTAINTGTFYLLNGLASGDAENNREGDSVRFKSLQSNIRIGLGTPSPVPSCVRLIYFIDLQTQGAAPALADILEMVTGSPVTALRNLNWRRRFLILKDKTYCLSPNGNEVYDFKYYRKLDLKTYYTATGNTITSIQSNPIYLLMLSDQATGSSAPTYDMITRLRYIDN